MAKEVEAEAITNWDAATPVQVTVVVTTANPAINWVVVCNADWSAV